MTVKQDVKYKLTSTEGVTIGYFLNGQFAYALSPDIIEGEVQNETDFISFLENPERKVTGRIENDKLIRLEDEAEFLLKQMA